MPTEFNSWGNYPRVEKDVTTLVGKERLTNFLANSSPFIPYGNGRSYGDSAINEQILHTRPYNYYLDFDSTSGLLKCQAGVLLSEVIETFVPRGWFLGVTPGTKYVTVGGAIASDVHGKNHHSEGSFSDWVEEIELMKPDGEIVVCSKHENRDYFLATCGGMGLTGIILSSIIRLKKIESVNIEQTIIKTRNLKETFEAFEKYKDVTYSVAWIDCFAKKNSLGRSLLMVGEHSNDQILLSKPTKKMTVPFFLPSFSLNKYSVKCFNELYYGRVRKTISYSTVSLESFFYPLDSINNWNRIYGKSGFTQYQFVLPSENSYDGLVNILTKIADSGKGSFLAVLKQFGASNSNLLSFPMEGYTLALDFKIEKGLFELLDKLDEIVVNNGGRIYLTKDVRVSKSNFELGYPKIDTFRKFREKQNLSNKIQSLQSKRLKL